MRKKLLVCLLMVSVVLAGSNAAWAAKSARSAKSSAASKTDKTAKTAKTAKKGAKGEKNAAPESVEPVKIKERNRKEIKYTGYDAKRDPFAAPEKIAKMIEKPATVGDSGLKVQLPRMELQGIIWAKNMPQVIINGAVMKVGDFIEEFEIKEITRTGIILFFKGRDYSVTMQSQNLPKKRKSK
jgi:hypothetical protein